jgi:hypothetical protein
LLVAGQSRIKAAGELHNEPAVDGCDLASVVELHGHLGSGLRRLLGPQCLPSPGQARGSIGLVEISTAAGQGSRCAH